MTKIIKGCAKPFNALATAIHGQASKHRHITACVIGAGVGFCGVLLAHMHQTVVPDVVQDFVGYGIHGLGITPILERILSVFEAEA